MDYRIMALKIGNREGTALAIQKVLTEYGCLIKVRLGLHNLPPNACSPLGLVIMELVGSDEEVAAMTKKLNAIPETTAKVIEL